jgi:hypothetical protein
MNDQSKGTRDENKPRRQQTLPDNPQREDLLKKQKGRAALAPREKKIANCSTILAEIHRTRAHRRTAAAKADPAA